MTIQGAIGDSKTSQGSRSVVYKDKSKPQDVRSSNINAAKGKHSVFYEIIINYITISLFINVLHIKGYIFIKKNAFVILFFF